MEDNENATPLGEEPNEDTAAKQPLQQEQSRPEEKSQAEKECEQEISEVQMAMMRDIAMAASQRVPCTPTYQHHRKTGRIRMPRDVSDTESTSTDDDLSSSEETDEQTATDQPPSTPGSSWKRRLSKTVSSPATSTSSAATSSERWIRTSTGKYAINPVKCPPCARRKKADKCRGGPPCKECWSKGRKTAAQCQEWGEGWDE